MTNVLPTKPSALIRVALKDLKSCEASSTYRINMNRWHMPDDSKSQCVICFAGAVMAQTLGTDPESVVRPSSFSHSVKNSLYALNFFREGFVKAGLSTLDLPIVLGDREISSYKDLIAFHLQMNALASDLQELGL